MDKELELKFEFSETSLLSLQTYFDSLSVLKKQTLQLNNTYYDTADNWLRNNQFSVRVRTTIDEQMQSQHEITVKSSGQSIVGLHQRNEVNATLPAANLDLSVLSQHVFGDSVDPTTLAAQLAPLFSTNFVRQLWLIRFNQSEIEIAIDRGTIITGSMVGNSIEGNSTAQVSLPIQEIELELKQGSQQDLVNFAVTLCQFKLHLFSQSKASRGYRLAQHSSLHKQPLAITTKPDSNYFLAEVLQYWQHNEEVALSSGNVLFYNKVLLNVSRQLNCFFAHQQHLLTSSYYRYFKGWYFTLHESEDIPKIAYSSVNTMLKLQLLLWLIAGQEYA